MRSWLQRLAGAIHCDTAICAPLIVAASLRAGFAISAYLLTGTRVMTQGDTSSYLGPGRNLILHGAFASSGLQEIDRTPGYPIFAELTGMIWNNVLLTVAAQILVSLASLLLIGRIADHVFKDRRAGILAAWLYAFEPLSIVYTTRLMPETFFVLLLLLLIERILTFESSTKLSTLAVAGASLTAATFVRPVTYYLVFPLAVALALVTPNRHGMRWKSPAILLVVVLPCLAAWQLRNFAETGYSGFSSIVEKNLYFFQSAEVTAELQHVSLGAEQERLGYLNQTAYFAAHPEQRAWSQAQRLRFMRAQAGEILAAHPALYLKTHFAGVGVVAFTPCASELLQLLGAYPPADTMPHRILNEGLLDSAWQVLAAHPAVAITMALLDAFLVALYVLALRGCLRAGHLNLKMWALLGIAFYFLLVSGGAQAVGRYRLPVMPELCILAAGGLAFLQKTKLRSHNSSAVEVTS